MLLKDFFAQSHHTQRIVQLPQQQVRSTAALEDSAARQLAQAVGPARPRPRKGAAKAPGRPLPIPSASAKYPIDAAKVRPLFLPTGGSSPVFGAPTPTGPLCVGVPHTDTQCRRVALCGIVGNPMRPIAHLMGCGCGRGRLCSMFIYFSVLIWAFAQVKQHMPLRQNLPMWRHRQAILNAFHSHRVMVLSGATGSGVVGRPSTDLCCPPPHPKEEPDGSF